MNKYFYFLWCSISFGKLAFSLYTMTLTASVFSLTDSAILAAFIMLAHAAGKLASTFVFPLAAEKFPLGKLLALSLLLQSILSIIVFGIIQTIGTEPFPALLEIYLFISITGFADGFAVPCRLALIPEMVADGQTGKANSLITAADQSFALLGWSLGAAAVSYYGSAPVLTASIVLFFLSFVCSLQFKTQRVTKTQKRPKTEVIKEGWSFLFAAAKQMRTITLMDLLEGVASGIWIGAISLAFVSEVLDEGEEWWGYINTAYYAGSIAGGVWLAAYAGKMEKHLIRGILIGSFAISLLVLVYAMNATPWLALALVVVMGPFYQLRDICQQTYIQKVVPRNRLSKLYAAKDNLYYLTFAISVCLTGLIADTLGVVYVYYFAFFLYFISFTFAVRAFKKERVLTSKKGVKC